MNDCVTIRDLLYQMTDSSNYGLDENTDQCYYDGYHAAMQDLLDFLMDHHDELVTVDEDKRVRHELRCYKNLLNNPADIEFMPLDDRLIPWVNPDATEFYLVMNRQLSERVGTIFQKRIQTQMNRYDDERYL